MGTFPDAIARLVVEQLCKEYPTPVEPLAVLEDVGFELRAGQSLAIVGPSGSGKSTLLQILGTLDRPTSGRVLYDNVDPFQLGETALARFRHDQVGFVFQDHFLLPQLTLLENVLVPVLANSQVSSSDERRARQLIDSVGLTPRIVGFPTELSGGERQRAAIARALIMNPSIVLADEPTGNLDQDAADRTVALLQESTQGDAARPRMLIMVTHNRELASMLDRQMVMRRRKLQGLPADEAT